MADATGNTHATFPASVGASGDVTCAIYSDVGISWVECEAVYISVGVSCITEAVKYRCVGPPPGRDFAIYIRCWGSGESDIGNPLRCCGPNRSRDWSRSDPSEPQQAQKLIED